MYECTLHIPLILRLPGVLPAGEIVEGITLHQDLVPTIMDLLEIDPGVSFDGKSQVPMITGEVPANYDGFYITECTWMRKHGWRTPEWKLIVALEPDFHGKPMRELFDLHADPDELCDIAETQPALADGLQERLEDWIRAMVAKNGLAGDPLAASDITLGKKWEQWLQGS